MRIFGLIALYATGLFLIASLLLEGCGDHIEPNQKITSNFNNSWAKAILPEIKENHEKSDSIGSLSKWIHRPVGLVRYPDDLTLDFLTNGE
ncbi:MAG: hypothetical protein ACK4HU_19460 [Algoriphagus sp.]